MKPKKKQSRQSVHKLRCNERAEETRGAPGFPDPLSKVPFLPTHPEGSPLPFVDALSGELLERGVKYFFPGSRFERLEGTEPSRPTLTCDERRNGRLELNWLGKRYAFSPRNHLFTDNQARLLSGIGRVLSARYQLLFDAALVATSLHLFRGLPEDRYVSAFLDASPYLNIDGLTPVPDRVTDAIEVLRITSLTTYENRRIATGVLLMGSQPDPYHELGPRPAAALAYAPPLTAIRSFHRLCDGLQTVALVDENGWLIDLVDVKEWSGPFDAEPLPAPCPAPYRPHSAATLRGGHIGLVLTPNGEIKVFAEGQQVFNFLDGRWRLTDAVEKYRMWQQAVGDARLAERIFTVALNLAEERRGGLFVVLNQPQLAGKLVSDGDRLDRGAVRAASDEPGAKNQLHYLLGRKRLLDLAPTVLETIARMDGAMVMDRDANLLSFGAILRNSAGVKANSHTVEGGRTMAAIGASRFGNVLKISEDGLVSFYQKGQRVWEI